MLLSILTVIVALPAAALAVTKVIDWVRRNRK